MNMRRLFLALLSFLVTQMPGQGVRAEKNGQQMRVAAHSPHGGYRLCKPMDGAGFRIEGSGCNEGVLLGYSPDGCLEKALLHPAFRLLLDAYDRAGSSQPEFRVLPATAKACVEPLLTDSWNQPEPYNVCAPMIGGRHCQVGCVALAMAQVMRYWRWPERGHGSHTYTDSTGCGQTLTADFAHEYRWHLMRDVYEGAVDSSDVGLLEAGRLMRDCGVAVEMRYGLEASGARSVRQAIALNAWFGYDAGMQLYYRDFFSRAEWEGMLMEELSGGRPVLFAAQSPSLSHALVCDGYDQDGLFHMNFGLGGDADGYYYLPHLTPKQPLWYDPDSPEGGMNLLQSMIVGVRPAEAGTVGRHSLGMASIDPVVASASRLGRVSVATRHLANVGWNSADSASVRLVLLHGDDVVADLTGYPHAFELEELYDTAYTDTLSFAVAGPVANGVYRVCPAVREVRGGWTLARTSMGTPSHLLLRVGKDSLTLLPDSSVQARLTLLSWEFPDSVQRGQCPPFSLSVRNESEAEYCGRLSVMLREKDNPSRCHRVQYQGLWLSPGEEVTCTFRRTRFPMAEGDYDLCLAYDTNLFDDSLVWLSPNPVCEVRVCPAAPTRMHGVEEGPACRGVVYGLDGCPKPAGQHGIGVERKNGKYRKTYTR